MHEVAIAEGILEVVLEKAAGEDVRRVRLRVGDDLRVSASALRSAFELVAAGTLAEGAALEIGPIGGDALRIDGIEVPGGWRAPAAEG